MKPFIKWVGGKRELAPKIIALLTKDHPIRDYYEPMVVGGAVFFELKRQGLIARDAWLGDENDELMNAYRMIEDEISCRTLKVTLAAQSDVYRRAWESEEKSSAVEALYYSIRAMDPGGLSTVARAARFVFINKSGFNGLYRVNKHGHCNVPWGHARHPAIFDERAIDAAHKALTNAALVTQSIFAFDTNIEPEDAVYIDPPYVPLTTTADFTSYTANGFGEQEQRRLAELFGKLAERGARVVLSNSDTPLVRDLYEGFTFVEVEARRRVNRDATKRGKVGELLICANIVV